MLTDRVVLAVFTGTGNTLLAAEALAQRLAAAGKDIRLVPMEKPEPFESAGFDPDTTLGLAVPVACFTTYPTAWRFLEALPAGKGRGVFFLATMGGMGAGMQGPVGRTLTRKGYRLLASATVSMCGNYAGGVPADDKREAVYAGMRTRIAAFSEQLLAGRGRWGLGRLNPVSAMFRWLGRKRTSFRYFRKLFPLTVDADKCTGCRLCAELCPEQAVAMKDGKAEIGAPCQSCQRCIGFCPAGAIHFPDKPLRQYRAVSLEALKAFLRGGI